MSANEIAIFTIDSKRRNKEDFYSAAGASHELGRMNHMVVNCNSLLAV